MINAVIGKIKQKRNIRNEEDKQSIPFSVFFYH